MSQIVILVDQSSKLSPQSSLGSASMEPPQYSFIQQSDNVGASRTRRAVRSHAMKAVRRQQRQENVKTSQLTWPEKKSSSIESQLANLEVQYLDVAERRSQSQHQRQSPNQEERAFGSLPPHRFQESVQNREEDELNIDSSPRVASTRVHRRFEWVEDLPFVERLAYSRTLSSEAEEEKPSNGKIIREVLGAGRVDPFQTFPVRADRSMSELMDHYVTILPAIFSGIRARKPIISPDLYRIAITHQASVHAMTAYASKSLDVLRRSDTSTLTLSHTMRAVQGVNESLLAISKGRDDRDNGVILAIALLAFAELRFGRHDVARQHWIGLRVFLRYRGGFSAIRCNHSLKVALAWNSTVWSSSRYSKNVGSLDLPSLVEPETREDLYLACQDFITYFHQLNDNSYSHSVYSEPDDLSHTTYPYKYSSTARKVSLFAPGTPFHRLFAPGSDNLVGLSQRRTSDACRMPCLLYINAVVLEYANAPYLIDCFFSNLNNAFYEDNPLNCVSPEYFLMQLLLGIDGAEKENEKRLYTVTRLAYVAKRLRKSSFEMARSALLENLVRADGERREKPLFMWDPAVLEMEILRN